MPSSTLSPPNQTMIEAARAPTSRGRVEHGVVEDRVDVGVAMGGVDLVKARAVSSFPAEQLHRRHAGDVFLQERVDARDPRADRAVGLAHVRAKPLRDHGNQRQHEEAGQREAPVHPEHHDHDAGQREDVAEDGDDAGREQLVEHVDVAGHARHQPADGVAVVEPQVQPLQVRVQLHPQVVHDALARQLHHPGLHVLEREGAREHREVDHATCTRPPRSPAGM